MSSPDADPSTLESTQETDSGARNGREGEIHLPAGPKNGLVRPVRGGVNREMAIQNIRVCRHGVLSRLQTGGHSPFSRVPSAFIECQRLFGPDHDWKTQQSIGTGNIGMVLYAVKTSLGRDTWGSRPRSEIDRLGASGKTRRDALQIRLG